MVHSGLKASIPTEQDEKMTSPIHAMRPVDGGLMRETLCGSSFGFPTEGGFHAFATVRRRLIRAVDFGNVTCKRCARAQRGAVQ